MNDIKLYGYTLDGRYTEVGPIKEITLTTSEGPYTEREPMAFNGNESFSFTVNISKSQVLRLCGCSNNWLKMHGYPMIRKRALFLASNPTKPR